ncbi:hypothetical protein [Vagococcus intermedius]|uniref:Membrane protein NfeD2 N-terminal transmembrane domain-containing protein n=1 Tax=Vagococcus intermedius TaxID=2991418 RepID=A0AAF0CVR3_9ENTE|nr:hypothetical protein [Vagococcus intermedius]WEG73880.1 hypothetical protein OL234_02920 [Vagococcus intermedius]WEG75965.1 hypothetical protein OL235_02930 [Vagococcus intermedius]
MSSAVEMTTIYFYVLIVCASLSVLLVFFGDILEVDGPIAPILVIPWLAFSSLGGYLGEHFSGLNSFLILFISALIATVIVFFLNFYVIVPIKNADATLSSSEKDWEGRIGQVVTPIPQKGMGEILLKNVTGATTRPAKWYEVPQKNVSKQGEKVLIIEIKDRVCYVIPYDETVNFN